MLQCQQPRENDECQPFHPTDSDGVRSYTYDHDNRLTQVVSGTLTTQYAYNGDGVRTSKTVDGITGQYVLDLTATLPVVISDTDAVYLYGLDIIAQQQEELAYYMHDGLGSVRQLLDDTGEVETSYTYDPFGVPVVGGEAYNPYQYTGEAWEAEVGLLYLRARYYQPEVGRFITRDPWEGDLRGPGTLNQYVYTLNNPANLVDRSGYQGCIDLHCDAPILDPLIRAMSDKLEREYGILTGGYQMSHAQTDGASPNYRYGLWSDWEPYQLLIVQWAARDFADKLQGREGAFRAKMAPLHLYRSQEGSRPAGSRGMTSDMGIILSGLDSDWLPIPEMEWTVVHELAHWWDINGWFAASAGMLTGGMWQLTAECELPHVSVALEVRDWFVDRERPQNVLEDWADSVATYVYWEYAPLVKGPHGPKYISERRWDFVAHHLNPRDPEPYPWGHLNLRFGP